MSYFELHKESVITDTASQIELSKDFCGVYMSLEHAAPRRPRYQTHDHRVRNQMIVYAPMSPAYVGGVSFGSRSLDDMACTQKGTNDLACPQCGHPSHLDCRSLDHIYNTRMHEQASPLCVDPEHPGSQTISHIGYIQM